MVAHVRPQRADRDRDDARRRRRHARRPRHGRVLLVRRPRRPTCPSGPGPILGPGGDDDPSARGFHRCGPATSGCGRAAGRRPQRVAALGIDTLPGVGAALAKRLRALGLETVGDLLLHRPRRYEPAVDEVAISQLWGDEEVAIAGVVQDVRTRRLGGRRTIVTARDQGRERHDRRLWFNQPWLADKLTPGTHLRLRGKLGRYGFDVKSYDVGEAQATADFAPVYPASEQVPSTKLRELVRVALAQVGRYLPDALPAELDAAARVRRDRGDPLPARRGGGRGGAAAARARRALHAAARRRALTRRGRRRDCARPSRATLVGALPRRAAVRADRAPGARDRRDRPRPRAHDADAAAAAGRRRLGQDGRRALRAAARGRERPAGRADGADRDARRAALPDARAALRAARRPLRPAHRAPSARRRSATRSRTATRRSRSARTR